MNDSIISTQSWFIALSKSFANSWRSADISSVWAADIVAWFSSIMFCGIVWAISLIPLSLRMVPWTTATITIVSTTQMRNWVSPTRAMPIILPIISWTGFTEDTITSTTLLVFSSMTPLITIDPNMKTRLAGSL